MPSQAIKSEISQPAYSLSQTGDRVRLRNVISPWAALRYSLARLQDRSLTIWYIWHGALRSLRGHIRSQSSRETPTAFVGQELSQSPDGSYQPNTRTLARSLYIEMLLATRQFSWADTADLRIFLAGFDAGEQWTLYTTGNGKEILSEHESWLTPAQKDFGCVPDLMNQEIKAAKGQISVVTPAVIAGVTRRDECTRQKL
jgi:hypothetical protein